MVVKSNFGQVKREVGYALEDLAETWKDEGEEQCKNSMTKQESKTGYDFNDAYDSIKSKREGDEAAFGVDIWYWHFFEYGTLSNIPPTPVVRPAKRKADKKLKSEADNVISRRVDKAEVRKW